MLDLDAGPHAAYVWTAFGLTGAVFAAMIWAALAYARRWKARARSGEAP